MSVAITTGEVTDVSGEATAAQTRAGRRGVSAVLHSAWLPAILVMLFTAAALRFYGVPLLTTGIFATYIALCVTLPGALLWRTVQRRSGSFVADVAIGTALGYALEVLLYIPSRALGLPQLILLFPVATVALFLALPRLRKYWRGSTRPHDRTPTWWAWSMAAVFVVLVVWSCLRFFRVHGLEWPYFGAPDADSPFHLALIGEAKHHLPMMSPWLPEQPVLYHWFVYAEMAATSWVTGIEPHVLLLRLSLLPMLAATVVLIAVLARKLTRLWWTGPAAAVLTFFVLAPNPYPWPLHGWFSSFATSPTDDGSSFRVVLWTSPTQTFGVMLFVPVVIVLADLLRGRESARRWGFLAVMLVAVMGAKATFLPIVLAALALVTAVGLFQRKWNRPALIAGAMVFACLAFAQFVLFGGASQGLQLKPLNMTRISGGAYTTGFTTGPDVPPWRLLLIAAITIVCWAGIWFGIAGLLKKRALLEPTNLLLLGIGLAGMSGIMLLGHEGGAEGWFLLSARPYLAVAAVVGLAALTAAKKMTWRIAVALAAAVASGFVLMKLVRALGSNEVPESTGIRLAFDLTWPYLLVFGVTAAIGITLMRLARQRPDLRGVSFALIVCVLSGLGIYSTANHLLDATRDARLTEWRNYQQADPFFAEGSREAGRWLRDHSDPADLVATNAHCLPYPGTEPGLCDNRHFHFAAFAERRMLVEGWGFTARTHVETKRQNALLVFTGYWDQQKLADNDAVFAEPSAEAVRRLAGYGVKWLLADESATEVSPALGSFATLRFRAGKVAVYQMPG